MSDDVCNTFMKQFTCIDLFCGCGGFSLGLERAGFKVLAAIDFNPEAISVFRQNFPTVPHVLERDLTTFSPEQLAALIESDEIELIAGGPPCQGFSTVRQRDGANHGPRLVEDNRRRLYQTFLDYVDTSNPRCSSWRTSWESDRQPADVISQGFTRRRERLGIAFTLKLNAPMIWEFLRSDNVSSSLGRVMTCRIISGVTWCGRLVRSPVPPWVPQYVTFQSCVPAAAMKLQSMTSTAKDAYWKYGRRYLHDVLEVHRSSKLTAHRARPHSERDLRDFAKLHEGDNCGKALKRGETFEFPYDKGSFKDRYTRQDRNAPCSTIVAHLSKDGLMFIHPTQNRSLTAREAARIQSFPDWFEFPVSRTHQYRVIGNAVPPLVAEAVGLTVRSYLEKVMTRKKSTRPESSSPVNEAEAVQLMLVLVDAGKEKRLQKLSENDFRRGWYAISFLFPGLHPDGALDHGKEISTDSEMRTINGVNLEHLASFYLRSGWPVLLAPVAKEAWRRYEIGALKDDEFYCSEAAVAGMVHRKPGLEADVGREKEKRPA